jgi:uncharacterized coiled-coil DUF342 family protein
MTTHTSNNELGERIARLETKVDILVETQKLLVEQMREALELQRSIKELEARDREHSEAVKRLHARIDEHYEELDELRDELVQWKAKATVIIGLLSAVGPIAFNFVMKQFGG